MGKGDASPLLPLYKTSTHTHTNREREEERLIFGYQAEVSNLYLLHF